MTVFGGGAFGRSRLTGSALMNGVNVLIKETWTLSALYHLKPQEKTDTCKPESRFSPDPDSADALILDFSASRPVWSHVCCLSHPANGIFAAVSRVDQDSPHRHMWPNCGRQGLRDLASKELVSLLCLSPFGLLYQNTSGLPWWLSGKEPSCQFRSYRRCRFDPWVGKSLWRRKWQPTPVFLPGESHEQGSLVGCSPWGPKELDMIHTHIRTPYTR